MTGPGRRMAAAAILGAAALGLAVLFWPWLEVNAVAPLALLAWLLLRLFVLSIDQRLFWLALIVAVPWFLAAALRRQLRGGPAPAAAGPGVRVHPIEAWRVQIEQAVQGLPRRRALGWDGFVQLVVSLQALERRVPRDYQLHDALRSGEVPLPPGLQAFLFPCSAAAERGLAGLLRRLRRAPSRALGRLSGRHRTERLRSVGALLTYLEDSLEMPSHDLRRP